MSGISSTAASRSIIRCAAAVALLELVVGLGCSEWSPSFVRLQRVARSGWIAGYEDGVKEARKSDQGLLIYYRTTNMGERDAMFDAVKTGLRGSDGDLVHCCVFASNEPDRRFVRQYGVQRPPALIVIHPDGSYHAAEGPRSAEQVSEFLAGAQQPGATPTNDTLLPRDVTYDWHSSFASAQSDAEKSGKSIFVVLDRWMTRDWFKLGSMVECRDVHSRVADMVHCRPNAQVWSSVDEVRTRLGVTNLPAVVVVRPDGSHRALELPASSDAIARFIDASTAPAKSQP